MRLFFDNIDHLDQFTHGLDQHIGSIACQHCLKPNQLVPHGFVYKNQHLNNLIDKEPVGKRLLCSNRYGRTGCGRTIRLYLADNIPALSRTAIPITLFFLALLSGKPIQLAYKEATRTNDPRNAYRWLCKCQARLTRYRAFLVNQREAFTTTIRSRSERLQILLPTIEGLRIVFSDSFVADFQLALQQRFM
ncbi:MAG: hypothetical protein JKY67_00460 [Pseudomonadales bacterium]|nr:hypothetical protein [Pseudomonadales bacterium]